MLELPPSVNKLYTRTRNGGKALTKFALKFRENVRGVVMSQLGMITLPTDKETVYQMDLRVYFEKLENPGWFQVWEKDTYFTRGKNKGELKGKAGERKAKTRYKILDVDNRIKFLQDCVIKSLGIPDDCQVFCGSYEKHEAPNNPRAEVRISVTDRALYFPS